MPFYYLREKGSSKPASEKDFEYLVYNEEPTDKHIIVPHDNRKFLAHKMLDKPLWHWEDEIIDVVNKNETTTARFQKVYTETGFTVWKQVSLT